MHPEPYPSAWISPVLRLWLQPLLKPASLQEFTQVWGMWCTSSSQPCLRTCIPFTHFSLGPSLKNWVCPLPPLGPALPTLRSHLYCCSYAMKPDGRRANHIIVENSWLNRKETLIISVKLQPKPGCNQYKKQDFQTQEALHHQTYMKDKSFCRSTNN